MKQNTIAFKYNILNFGIGAYPVIVHPGGKPCFIVNSEDEIWAIFKEINNLKHEVIMLREQTQTLEREKYVAQEYAEAQRRSNWFVRAEVDYTEENYDEWKESHPFPWEQNGGVMESDADDFKCDSPDCPSTWDETIIFNGIKFFLCHSCAIENLESDRAALLKLLDDLTPVYYITQEAAFAPGIVKEWPEVISLPGNKNGRLVKRTKLDENNNIESRMNELRGQRNALLKLLGELQDEVKQAADLIWDLRIPYEHKGRPVEEASSILNNLLTRIEQIQKEGDNA